MKSNYDPTAKFYFCQKFNSNIIIFNKYYSFDIKNIRLEKLMICSCPLFRNSGITYGEGFNLIRSCSFKEKCLKIFRNEFNINTSIPQGWLSPLFRNVD